MRVHPSELGPAHDALLVGTCPVCRQPECDDSVGGSRPEPGSHAPRLERGQRDYRGYGEWLVHPDEARFVLHRGYAVVDGVKETVRWRHNEAFGAQIYVGGTHRDERRAADRFVDPAFTEGHHVRAVENAA